MIRSFAEWKARKKEPSPLKNYIITFKTLSPLSDYYSVITATSEEKAEKIARSQFGAYVSAIMQHSVYNEQVLQWNFKKEKLADGLKRRSK